ncbi:hypothetical protein OEB99_02355 [Actinotalea sp. M2MS4P-6]|uniref:hypothetical protein n=1 Tax=Actinotalea sp. M2MS4P-6 TaxID=2983762 RepID=UPI0021E4A85C|nr:hypothetical protein [Actinotalea sp. M2MS4P-6]MCV2393140.1 hypothetical protein [Actinotalea sp. M2MS4P-6]
MRDLVAEWSGEAFRAQAAAWIDDALASVRPSVRRTGPLSPHKVRFWAAVFGVPTSGGRLWFKVANPGQAFEGALLAALAELASGSVIAPIAVDVTSDWWLLPDGGPTLADRGVADPWPALVAQAADLQRTTATHRDRFPMLPRLGTSDATAWARATLADLAALPASDPQHVPPAQADRLAAHLPELEADLALLDDLGLPETVQLNDTNPRNACWSGDPGDRLRYFDVGDAFWSHPFGVLHLPVRLAVGVGLSAPRPTGPAADAVVEAYLSRWPEVPRERWSDVLRAADRLGAVHRAASWLRLLAPVDPERLGVPTPRIVDWIAGALVPEPPA